MGQSDLGSQPNEEAGESSETKMEQSVGCGSVVLWMVIVFGVLIVCVFAFMGIGSFH